MKVEIIKECGYEEALLGLSLSYNQVFDVDKMKKIALKLYNKDGGHNKFLESMLVWIDINAPRYWWQQIDTYRVGITKQSGSTMHTIMKQKLDQNDFDDSIEDTFIEYLNKLIMNKKFDEVKAHLPESFLQRRIVCTNYKTLRNIILQRNKHRLKQWKFFIEQIYLQVQYPEFLPKLNIK